MKFGILLIVVFTMFVYGCGTSIVHVDGDTYRQEGVVTSFKAITVGRGTGTVDFLGHENAVQRDGWQANFRLRDGSDLTVDDIESLFSKADGKTTKIDYDILDKWAKSKQRLSITYVTIYNAEGDSLGHPTGKRLGWSGRRAVEISLLPVGHN